MVGLRSGLFVWLPLVALTAFVLGGMGAREELAAYKKSAQASRKQSAARMNGFDTFAGLVKIPETTRRPRKVTDKKRKEKSPSASGEASSGQQAARPAADAAAPVSAPRRSVEDLSVRIEEAQELWRARVEMARGQWKEKLRLSGAAEQAFDAALKEMNERLYDSVQLVAEMIAESDTMTPELGLRLVGETTAIMAETYDKIGACVAPESRGDVSTMQIVDFVDPGVADPLIAVQGKIQHFGMQMRRNP